jgi:hypothetical protein
LAGTDPLDEFLVALRSQQDVFGSDWDSFKNPIREASRGGILGFLNLLVVFRNKVYGHSTMLPGSVARVLAGPALGAVTHVLGQSALLEGRMLARPRTDPLETADAQHWTRFAGVVEERVGPVDGAVDPELLSAVDAGKTPIPLSFFLAHDQDDSGLSRFGFFQGIAGRKKSLDRAKELSYLDYLGGPFRYAGTVSSLRAVVGTVNSAADEAKVPDENLAYAGRRRLGDFVIGDQVGQGAMGVVYTATQMSLER